MIAKDQNCTHTSSCQVKVSAMCLSDDCKRPELHCNSGLFYALCTFHDCLDLRKVICKIDSLLPIL